MNLIVRKGWFLTTYIALKKLFGCNDKTWCSIAPVAGVSRHTKTMLNRLDSSSIATLKRLIFRLIVVFAFATLWPGWSIAMATAVFCVLLAASCLIAAYTLGEPFGRLGLNHWDEAMILILVGILILQML
jgi:hypothetical protein